MKPVLVITLDDLFVIGLLAFALLLCVVEGVANVVRDVYRKLAKRQNKEDI